MDFNFSNDMASHVLNPSYHHERLHPIGYPTLCVKNDCLSSESSGHPNSPEYSQISVSGKQNSGSISDYYISNQSITSQSYQDISSENYCSDEEYYMKKSEGKEVYRPHVIDMGARENEEVFQVNFEDKIDEEIEIHHIEVMDNLDLNTSNDTDDHSLVEGLDYEVIFVYTVDPHSALLDSSSEDDEEEYITGKKSSLNVGNFTSYTWQDEEDRDSEVTIVSNVDENFVKNQNKDQKILNVDEPVVQNVDEYFFDLGNNVAVPNVDDYFIKHKLPEERYPQFQLPDSTDKSDFFFTDNNKPSQEIYPQPLRLDTVTNIDDIFIDESDLKALPKIDDLNKYFIDDTTFTQNQTTCSAPPSPMQNTCMDVDDMKNCFDFDHLNLNPSNNSNGTEMISTQGKSEDVLKTLAEDGINSFICKYSNTYETVVKHNEDDSSPQDMEIETTISSGPLLLDIPASMTTSTPMPTVLNFCIEKTSEKVVTPVKESKIDLDDSVDEFSPTHSNSVKSKIKTNNSVTINSAHKDSDNYSRNSSIKLTIKNKSEIILNRDYIHSHKDKTVGVSCKNSVNMSTNNQENESKHLKELDNNKCTVVNSPSCCVEEEPQPKKKRKISLQEYKLRRGVSVNTSPEVTLPKLPSTELDKAVKYPQSKGAVVSGPRVEEKKKLSLQEYKLKRGASSNTRSVQGSPELVFPDLLSPGLDKTVKSPEIGTTPNDLINTTKNVNNEEKFFDPIKEAGRKFLMKLKKQQAKAIRKRDEDIVMCKIPKVDANMMKLIEMTKPDVLKPPIAKEKPRSSLSYEQITLVSVGVNTHKDLFQKPVIMYEKTRTTSPPVDSQRMLQSDHVLEQNVFDIMKRENKIPIEQKKQNEFKINTERYRHDTTALKSVKKQVDSKMSSNLLFASIRDVVAKKIPGDIEETYGDRHLKSKSNIIDKCNIKCPEITIVREYDSEAEHGEDKVILHLAKDRNKPKTKNILVQTDPMPEFTSLISKSISPEIPLNCSKKCNYSDMSLFTHQSPSCKKKVEEPARASGEKVIQIKEVRSDKIEREKKEKRSRSKDRYEFKYRCSPRSTSRSCRRRSRSRSQSRSHGRYRRYQRSDSPYKKERRSRSRSHHKRRSPSVRRDRPKKSDSKSHPPARPEVWSNTPVKRFKTNTPSNTAEKKYCKLFTPPLIKPTPTVRYYDSCQLD